MRSANGPVKIKICGLRTLSDVQAVNGQLPEYTGFIFDPLRKRYISPEQAEELRRRLDARIRPVGVFVNAGTEEIRRVLEICRKPEAERAKNTSEKPEYCVPEMKIQRIKMIDSAMPLHFSGISAPFLTEKR